MNKIIRFIMLSIIGLFIAYNIFLVIVFNIMINSPTNDSTLLYFPITNYNYNSFSLDDSIPFSAVNEFYFSSYHSQLLDSITVAIVISMVLLVSALLIITQKAIQKFRLATSKSLSGEKSDDYLVPFIKELDVLKQKSLEVSDNFDQISGYVAHEQKNVLNILRIGIKTGEMSRDELLDQIDLINKSLDDILALTTNKITFEEVDLTLTIASVIDNYPKANIEYDFSEAQIMGSTNLVIRAMSNIIENSIKYATNDGAVIDITTQITDSSTIIKISDQGRNIDPKIIEKIVTHSFQVDTNLDGYGIGLSLVKRVMEVHFGVLDIQNNDQGIDVRLVFSNKVQI